MPSPTPNPSASDILGGAKRATGRISIALQEIATRLEATLPGVIAAMNTREGWTEADGIHVPQWYAGGAIDIGDAELNGIAISATSSSEVLGPQAFVGTYEIVIYSIDASVATAEEYQRHWDRAELIKACLKPFLTGCVNANGRQCWKTLVPSTSGFMLDDWKEYGGISLNYTLRTDPSMNSWEVA